MRAKTTRDLIDGRVTNRMVMFWSIDNFQYPPWRLWNNQEERSDLKPLNEVTESKCVIISYVESLVNSFEVF